MSTRNNKAEEAAAKAVVRVVGGEWEINDTGAQNAQYDVLLSASDGRTIALEVTSIGGDDWKRTTARINAEQAKGTLDAKALSKRWFVVVPSGIAVRDATEGLEDVLLRLEETGTVDLPGPYTGAGETLRDISASLQERGVKSVWAWEDEEGDFTEDAPRIFVLQTTGGTGTAGSLPAVLNQLFAKGDNQTKLARSETDERHLYVLLEDGGAARSA